MYLSKFLKTGLVSFLSILLCLQLFGTNVLSFAQETLPVDDETVFVGEDDSIDTEIDIPKEVIDESNNEADIDESVELQKAVESLDFESDAVEKDSLLVKVKEGGKEGRKENVENTLDEIVSNGERDFLKICLVGLDLDLAGEMMKKSPPKMRLWWYQKTMTL
ncbi:hypothetical protein HC766_07335 [Candidatus Gracilibacteria bacterium]|nr:hypothetical protein [Candidatus Gracilibacteria bacterium]